MLPKDSITRKKLDHDKNFYDHFQILRMISTINIYKRTIIKPLYNKGHLLKIQQSRTKIVDKGILLTTSLLMLIRASLRIL